MKLSNYPKTCLTEFKEYDHVDVVQAGSCSKKVKTPKIDYFPTESILNCDKNNSSRACPIMFCNINYENEMNKNIYNRNLYRKCENLLFPRETFQTNTYEYIKDKTEVTSLTDSNCFKNINDESKLLNINEGLSKCSRKEYKPKQNNFNRLRSNITMQQIHNLPHPDSNKDSENNDRFLMNECFQFEKKDYCPDCSKCEDPTKPLVNFQEYNDDRDSNDVLLPLGPTRCDYVPCELPWNNVTKRHYKTSRKYKFNKCNTPLYNE